MAFKRDDIERVREATDLGELVAEVTKVKRSGRSVMAVCPFHQEKTPSMSVDVARGLYHCFGCGKSGDVFRFVQETQGLDFTDSLELLARRAGVTLSRDPEAAKRRSRRQAVVDATALAVEFYHDRLKQGRDAGEARKYVRSRGYDRDVVDTFRIGYSPDAGEALVGHLKRKKVPEDVMVTSGLASRARTGRVYDRFRNRLMFPTYDVRGDAVGFGARRLGEDGPKYLNSPETPAYHKSRLLYGLERVKGDMVRDGLAVVVEGYTDVIALHALGLPAVATCGTALGEDHLDLLRRFTERVVLMFDADEAGAGANVRGFERSVPGDLDLRVAQLPGGTDPADLVGRGEGEIIKKAIADSAPLLQFRIERELERFDLAEPEARGRAVRATAGLISQHPDRITRHEYGVFVSRRTGVEMDVVTAAVDAALRSAERQPERAGVPADAAPLTGAEKAERELLRLLLANDPGVRDLDIGRDTFAREEHAAAYELVAGVISGLDPGEPPDLGALLGEDDSDVAVLLRGLAFSEAPLPSDAAEVVRRVQVGALDSRIHELRSEVAALDAEAEPERYRDRFGELIRLERQRREQWEHT